MAKSKKLDLEDFREHDDDEYAIDRMAGYKAARSAEAEAMEDAKMGSQSKKKRWLHRETKWNLKNRTNRWRIR